MSVLMYACLYAFERDPRIAQMYIQFVCINEYVLMYACLYAFEQDPHIAQAQVSMRLYVLCINTYYVLMDMH